jgi:hypothetical protein
MSADLGDVHLFSGGRGGDDGEDGERRPSRPEYSGPLHRHVKQLLAQLKTDPRFSNVDPSIRDKIIDAAIELVRKIGSQKSINAARRTIAFTATAASTAMLGAIGFAIPLFLFSIVPGTIAALNILLSGAADSTDITKLKSQVYEGVVKKLRELNARSVPEQRREFANMSRHSAMSDVLPAVAAPAPTVSPSTGERQFTMRDILFNATRRGAGYQRVGASDEDGAPAAAGAGAGDGLTYADMRNAPTVPDSVRDRVLQMLKEKKKFPPMQAGERKKDD